MDFPKTEVPIVEIPLKADVQLFVKREDMVHPTISGNKYWKLFYNIKNYLEANPQYPMLITFGGAFSNHISAVSAVGRELGIPTMGIIRGDELSTKINENPTLKFATGNGMALHFVSRDHYRDKDLLTENFQEKFPGALLLPEGGTNRAAVEGIRYMLGAQTHQFDYLCTAVGTGGTAAGLSKFAENHQKIIGYAVVKDDSLGNTVFDFSQRRNFQMADASQGGYGKISDALVSFINDFYQKFGVPLEPIYTGKMMMKLLEDISTENYPKNAKILAFHTGGMQGVEGANQLLARQKRPLINFKK